MLAASKSCFFDRFPHCDRFILRRSSYLWWFLPWRSCSSRPGGARRSWCLAALPPPRRCRTNPDWGREKADATEFHVSEIETFLKSSEFLLASLLFVIHLVFHFNWNSTTMHTQAWLQNAIKLSRRQFHMTQWGGNVVKKKKTDAPQNRTNCRIFASRRQCLIFGESALSDDNY